MTQLSELEVELLDVAAHRWRYLGDLEAHVLDRFGLSLVRYHAAVNRLLDDPRAEAHNARLVRRLRRVRDARRFQRSTARIATAGGR